MIQLTCDEKKELVTNCDRLKLMRHSSKLPYVFTEQGVAMLSSVLKSKRAILVNIQIIVTFTRLREIMMNHKDLHRKIESMERKYDHQFRVVFEAIKKMLEPPPVTKRQIGFHSHDS